MEHVPDPQVYVDLEQMRLDVRGRLVDEQLHAVGGGDDGALADALEERDEGRGVRRIGDSQLHCSTKGAPSLARCGCGGQRPKG